jgi:hypothetical protein
MVYFISTTAAFSVRSVVVFQSIPKLPNLEFEQDSYARSMFQP